MYFDTYYSDSFHTHCLFFVIDVPMGDIFLLCSNFTHADEPYMQKLLFHLSKSVSGEVSSDSDSLMEYASKEWYDQKKKLLPMNGSLVAMVILMAHWKNSNLKCGCR